MKALVLVMFFISIALTGCATTNQKGTPLNQVQNQVVDLEQRMEEQEKEIVELKYDVKELTGKLEEKNTVEVETSSPTLSAPALSEAKPIDTEVAVIRVDATVKDVQTALKHAGVYDGKVDGKIGPRTKTAIVDFQKQHNLKSDGVIGKKTWEVLKTYLNPPAETEAEADAAE